MRKVGAGRTSRAPIQNKSSKTFQLNKQIKLFAFRKFIVLGIDITPTDRLFDHLTDSATEINITVVSIYAHRSDKQNIHNERPRSRIARRNKYQERIYVHTYMHVYVCMYVRFVRS